MRSFVSGLMTGLFLQLAVGPLFFFIGGITLGSNFYNALFAILGVTFVDYLYIILSILGVGKLLEKPSLRKRFGIISSIILIIFGCVMLQASLGQLQEKTHIVKEVWTPLSSFIHCTVLTLSSPLTIVFWSSIFTAKAIELHLEGRKLVLFGVGAGTATVLFLVPAMYIISLLKTNIHPSVTQGLNAAVGGIIILYGLLRCYSLLFKHEKAESGS